MDGRINPFTAPPLADAHLSRYICRVSPLTSAPYNAGREEVPKTVLSRNYTTERPKFYLIVGLTIQVTRDSKRIILRIFILK
jgi:hypothetical protein